MRRMSLGFDLMLLLRTMLAVFRRSGA